MYLPLTALLFSYWIIERRDERTGGGDGFRCFGGENRRQTVYVCRSGQPEMTVLNARQGITQGASTDGTCGQDMRKHTPENFETSVLR